VGTRSISSRGSGRQQQAAAAGGAPAALPALPAASGCQLLAGSSRQQQQQAAAAGGGGGGAVRWCRPPSRTRRAATKRLSPRTRCTSIIYCISSTVSKCLGLYSLPCDSGGLAFPLAEAAPHLVGHPIGRPYGVSGSSPGCFFGGHFAFDGLTGCVDGLFHS
jgi:hypothetical protein